MSNVNLAFDFGLWTLDFRLLRVQLLDFARNPLGTAVWSN